MKSLKLLKTLIIACSMLTIFTGCDDEDNNNAATSQSAPSNSGAFNGVTLSINPTIEFSGNSFTYTNNAGDESDFPDAGDSSLTGTFSYSPTTDGLGGTMTLDFSDSTPDLVITFTGFTGNGTAITSFEVSVNSKTFNGTITGGTLAPAPATETETDSGSGNGSTVALPASIAGNVFNLTLTFKSENAPDTFPYNVDDTENFTFSSSNKLFLGAAQLDLGLPQQQEGSSEFYWQHPTNGLFYTLSVNSSGGLNEINVNGSLTGDFYGQFEDTSSSGGSESSEEESESEGNNETPVGSGVAGNYFSSLEFTNTGQGDLSIPSSTGLNGAADQSIEFTIASSGDTPTSMVINGSSSTIPFFSDGGSAFIFKLDIQTGESLTIELFKNSTGGFSGMAISYLNVITNPLAPTNYTFSSQSVSGPTQ